METKTELDTLIDLIIDKEYTIAEKAASSHGYGLRAIRVNGEFLNGTDDYDEKRVNVEVYYGFVEKIVSLG